MNLRNSILSSAALINCLLPSHVFSQSNQETLQSPIVEGLAATEASNVKSFAPDYFAKFAPRAAMDMIDYVPGFSINESNSQRGIGQGGANILINGSRLTGKTGARDQLQRIASANVVRIEILDGTTLNIPGLSGQVANIITKSTGLTGIWKWEPDWRRNQEAAIGNGEISASGENGALGYTVLFEIDTRRSGNDGQEFILNADRSIVESRDERVNEAHEIYTLGTDLVWRPSSGHIANLSAEYNIFNSNDREISQRLIVSDNSEYDNVFRKSEDEWNARIGANYQLPLGIGSFKIIGEHRTEHSPVIFQVDEASVLKLSDNLTDEGESILRAEYSWSGSRNDDFQISLEGAYNYLEDEQTQSETGTQDSYSQTNVDERRAELNFTYGRALSKKLDIQSSLGVEVSELNQEQFSEVDDMLIALPSAQFTRPKGFLSGSYKVDDSLTIRSKIERKVGQLNFGDFVSSVDLQNGFDNAANPDLVPEQSWLANVEYDKNFGDGLTFLGKIYGAYVTDTVDSIPIGESDNAIGNIGEAVRYGLELSSALKGERWGFDGVQMDLALNLRETKVEDPLTGEDRPLSNSQEYFWSIVFRHDIAGTDWAYGAQFDQSQNFDRYRVDSIISRSTSVPRTRAYIEHKNLWGVKAQARILNFFDEEQETVQTNYSARRDIGVIEAFEERATKSHLFAQLRLSGTF